MSAAIHRTGRIHIHETKVAVWEEHVDEKGMSQMFSALRGFMRRRGHEVYRCPHTRKHYRSISKGHWLSKKNVQCDEDLRGDMEAKIEHTGRYVCVEFFQEINVENPNGGKHDFQKFGRMPHVMQRRCIVEMHALVVWLCGVGYELRPSNRAPFTAEPSLLLVRDLIEPPNETGTLKRFNEQWNSEHDWARGGRFKRDETGWPAASELTHCRDRDGVRIRNGEMRYVYYRGNLMRGVVRPNMNNMWTFGHFGYVSGHELFLCDDPASLPRRDQRHKRKRLKTLLGKATESENYARASVLAGVLARIEPQMEERACA